MSIESETGKQEVDENHETPAVLAGPTVKPERNKKKELPPPEIIAQNFLKLYEKANKNNKNLDKSQREDLNAAIENPAKSIVLANEIISSRADQLNEPHTGLAGADERISAYIAKILKTGQVLETQADVFEEYLKTVEGLKFGSKVKKAEATKLLGQIAELSEAKPKTEEQEEPFSAQTEVSVLDADLGSSSIIAGAVFEDTISQQAEETQEIKPGLKPETEKENPIENWNKLNLEIADEESQEQKKEKLWQIVEQGCKIIGTDFEQEKQKIKLAKEREWQNYANSQGGEQFLKKYGQQLIFSDKQGLSERYNAIIESSDLSDEQKEILKDLKKGEIGIGARIILEKEDAAILLVDLCPEFPSIDIRKTERGGWESWKKFFSSWRDLGTSFKIGGKEFASINALNSYIAEKKAEYIKVEAEKKFQERKNISIEKKIEPYVLESEINRLYNQFISKESKDFITGLGGNLENKENMMESLWKMQKIEDNYRAGKLNNREDHKKMARAMIELANLISRKDIFAEAKQEVEKDPLKANTPNKNQFIGNAIFEKIKKMTASFRETDKTYPFVENKK